MNPNPYAGRYTLPPPPTDADSVRERTREACAQVDRSTPSQHDPTSSSWKPGEAHDDPAEPALPWLTGRNTERRTA